MSVYQTVVKEVGPNAGEFLNEQMVVLFGGEAPPELKPFCFIIDKNDIEGEIESGDILVLDGEEYTIEGVGNQVNRNLAELGHITINLQEEAEKGMAGTLYAESKELVELSEGSTIEIKKPQ